jgi:hypothetical protein
MWIFKKSASVTYDKSVMYVTIRQGKVVSQSNISFRIALNVIDKNDDEYVFADKWIWVDFINSPNATQDIAVCLQMWNSCATKLQQKAEDDTFVGIKEWWSESKKTRTLTIANWVEQCESGNSYW